VLTEIVIVVCAYLSGSLPTALLVVRRATGKDVRETGSGNVGATNAMRSAGWVAGIVVTVIDVGKGVAPVWIMQRYHASSLWLGATMLAAVVGHCFPVWLRFRGGKGVATGFGAFLVLAPTTAGLVVGVWVLVLLLFRYVSLASMLASASFPVVLVLIERPPTVLMAWVCAAAVLIVLRHHSNIRNLVAGVEPKIRSGGPDGGAR
jgi:glycerol-3-phosphate acyltransferase PlsY